MKRYNRTADTTYRKNRAKLLQTNPNPTCWICGQPIDTTLPPHHPLSFTADHLHPISQGGNNHGKLLPAHHSCNSRRGNAKHHTTHTRNW